MGLNEDLNKRNSSTETPVESFDSSEYSIQLAAVGQQINEAKTSQQEEANELKKLLMNSEKEKIENFIGENCCEPIENVSRIVPFKELLGMIVQSAREEFDRVESSGYDKDSEEYKNAFEVRNKLKLFTLSDEEKAKLSDTEKEQMKGLAKDKRIYELPAYKNLIEKGFIIPSDIRTSYDSAEQKPVQHLGIDYNVKAGTKVKSIYEGTVVESCFTGEKPGDSSLGYKVVVEHKSDDGKKFYSLYGHLGKDELVTEGTKIKKGDTIGTVGTAFTDENGNWEEHLHFQIMEDKNSPEGYSSPEQGQIGNYDVLKAFRKE